MKQQRMHGRRMHDPHGVARSTPSPATRSRAPRARRAVAVLFLLVPLLLWIIVLAAAAVFTPPQTRSPAVAGRLVP